MMDRLIEILHCGNHSLVVANGDIRAFDGRGIADIYHMLKTEPSFLHGANVADKVIGKGAAALMILGGVRAVYADVISRQALSLLDNSDISVTYETLVDNIINRRGDGICPVEQLCQPCATAEECLPLITEFINSTQQ